MPLASTEFDFATQLVGLIAGLISLMTALASRPDNKRKSGGKLKSLLLMIVCAASLPFLAALLDRKIAIGATLAASAMALVAFFWRYGHLDLRYGHYAPGWLIFYAAFRRGVIVFVLVFMTVFFLVGRIMHPPSGSSGGTPASAIVA